jgi:hypothetical protein
LSPWDRFKRNHLLHRRHGITPTDLDALAGLSMLGSATETRDFLFMLEVIRKTRTQVNSRRNRL